MTGARYKGLLYPDRLDSISASSRLRHDRLDDRFLAPPDDLSKTINNHLFNSHLLGLS